ncbi:MKL/myocardin-like protein 2 [Xenopus tropicalis]|uniref:MKL/myocardin-like 2 n=1 Tax=Xenopus tropicalis TaxID=8364 RepID=A0A803KHK0_XENTR|nr:myocardin-related transcription factor B [Xenopus tropicalis]AAI23934.1 MKL/myocardin-like 2 [Xenopus tropicalis]|eukprot:NP_001072650.1 MKL/myocardin-like protein 2 [Xenopus tropicalis]
MIDSSKKQPGFADILAAGDLDPLKEKECLDPSSQKSLKEVLQLRLQQRRTREQLVDQGIMPPLKSPAAFHEQIKSLERARTENFLKHKIRSRPDRSELVRMHILEETLAEPSLQATQLKLKRARLADDLNEKIAQRPGPLELVEKNILPVDLSVKEAITVSQTNFPENLDTLSFDEDSSDALSPEQPASQESQGSAASPGEIKTSGSSSPISNTTIQCQTVSSPLPDFFKPSPTADLTTRSPLSSSVCKPGPALIKQTQSKHAEKPRSKKSKDPKPRVKKLKYHQYIPPDQKGEKVEAEMDSNYARLLQQQQLFLQLQILSQQQQHYNFQKILPAPLKSLKKQNSINTTTSNVNASIPSVQCSVSRQNSVPSKKTGPLPSNLDDMKVAELKMELKLRGLPVSGTKMDLIERLKPFQDFSSNGVAPNSGNIVTIATTACSTTEDATVVFSTSALMNSCSPTPSVSSDASILSVGNNQTALDGINSPLPMSPAPSEQSNFSSEDTNITDTFAEIMTMMSPSQFMNTSPLKVILNEDSMGATNGNTTNMELDAVEKDRKLQEKEKQIEDLKRKLEQEQKLVEVLKKQLELEKRGQQQQPCPNVLLKVEPKHFNLQIKEETAAPDCQNAKQSLVSSGQIIGQPTAATISQNIIANNALVIKHEVPLAKSDHQNVIQQFYVTSQRPPQTAVVAQPQALLATQTAQLLLPVSIKAPNGVQLSMVQAQPHTVSPAPTPLSTTAATTSLVQAPQKQPAPLAQDKFTQHLLNQNQQIRKLCPSATSGNVFSYPQNPVIAVPQSFSASLSANAQPQRNTQIAAMQNGPTSLQEESPTPPQPQQFIVQQHPVFSGPTTKSKDPPRYEEAIKQARNNPASQPEVSNAHSQQMDDLFDILIKSGEISPLIKEPSPISKMRPVTANVTTMPVNTVVSRPPPQIHVAPPLTLESTNSLSVSLESQLEAFLDGTLPSENNIPHLESNSDDRETFSLIDDLNNDLLQNSGMLDHDSAPMETSDTPFTANSCLSLDLADANLDNMEWLDLTMPNSASSLTPLSSTLPSMFSTDFLDSNDLQLHWE